MRIVPALLAIVGIAACSRSPDLPMRDFTAYLHLKPGTRIKVTPYIKVSGADDPVMQDFRDALHNEIAVTGTVTEITKTHLTIRPDKPDESTSFIAKEVRSIEVLPAPAPASP